jgi:hypothetical protein
MPRFDPDTIAALAEGRLSPDEAARVEAAIAQDPAALAELEMQRAALAALATAADLHLTELERSGLRASVADALGLVDVAPDTVEEPRRVPWGALGVAAAALAGLIAVVPVVGLLNTGGSDDADTALAPTATTSRELDQSAGGGQQESAADTAAAVTDDGAFNAGDEAPGEELLGFASSTTVAARTTTTGETIAAEADENATTTTAASDPEEGAPIDRLVEDLAALRDDPAAVEEVAAEALPENLCWTEDTEYRGAENQAARWSFEYDDGEQTVVVFFQYDAEGVPGPFTIYETAGCTAVAEVPTVP